MSTFTLCQYTPVRTCDEVGVNSRFALLFTELCNLKTKLPPNDIYTVVKTGNIIQPGDLTYTLTNFIGWRLRFTRSSVPQFLGNPLSGNTYFGYDITTGIITFSVAAGQDEELIFQAY